MTYPKVSFRKYSTNVTFFISGQNVDQKCIRFCFFVLPFRESGRPNGRKDPITQVLEPNSDVITTIPVHCHLKKCWDFGAAVFTQSSGQSFSWNVPLAASDLHV